jgi:hypothetical protein
VKNYIFDRGFLKIQVKIASSVEKWPVPHMKKIFLVQAASGMTWARTVASECRNIQR